MPVLRPCSVALSSALAAGPLPSGSAQADLFTVTLQNGTVFRWTSFEIKLTVAGNTFLPGNTAQPWAQRSRWSVTNTMEVATLEVLLDVNNTVFSGGLNLKTLIHNGYFDGASLLLQRVYMPTPGDTTTWGTVDIFSGDSGSVQIGVVRSTLKVRSKNSRLSVNTPRNVYQPSCIHTFCDTGCTLSAASFTVTRAADTGCTTTVIPWTPHTIPLFGTARFKGGTLTMTSGATSGQVRSIIDSNLFVVTLAYPLSAAPTAGDTLTLFAGCDKTMATCTSPFNNFDNFRGFPFIPPPGTNAIGQGQ